MKNFINTMELSLYRLFTLSKLPLMRGTVQMSLLFGLMMISLQVVSAATFTVTTTADDGAGSLRQAIISANADATQDTITFNLPPPQTISPLTQLPAITQPVIIDGYTQPGATANTLTVGDNAILQVGLNGGAANSTALYGLRISASSCIVRGLIITRFQEAGIRIDGGTGSSILGNFIGTNAFSDAGLGNFNRGILIVGSSGNFIGDGTAAGRNVISGNSGTGISITSATVGQSTSNGSAIIVGNYIGTDINGTADIGNTQEGIRIVNASNSDIGALGGSGSDLKRNVISGNNSHGVLISQDFGSTATNNLVRGNYIGVDANGAGQTLIGGFSTSTVGNSGSGVVVQAPGNIIGGGGSDLRNVISGNRANGISISTNFSTSNTVVGNYIGTAADGTTVIGNRDNGIQISNLASGNIIGGTTLAAGASCTGVCNLIANNGASDATSARAGVYLDTTAGTGNRIRINSIFMNAGIGIDLGTPGATANDANDADTGPNDLQNSPVLSAADTNGVVAATLNSTPNTTFAIDFYRNNAADTAVGSEARTFIGTIAVTTNASGNANINFNSGTTNLTAGQFVTATATSTAGAAQAIGDTSEISNAQLVTTATGASPGFEADVAPRPNGNGSVTSTDVSQVQGFQLGFGLPYQSNEFQRADCAPFDSRGDGRVTSIDVSQAQGYQLGFNNPPQPAAGPTGPTAGTTTRFEFDPTPNVGKSDQSKSTAGVQAPREVRVTPTMTSAGQTVVVPIAVDAMGDESVYGFSLSYDSTKLSNPVLTIGNAGGSVSSNTTQSGQIGVSVTYGGGTIMAGSNKVLINVQFTVANNASAGATPINFTDQPTIREVASAPGAAGGVVALPTTFTSGNLTITGTTAALVTLRGRVGTAKGAGLAGVEMVLSEAASGERQTTVTDEAGNYRFDNLLVGADYIITPNKLKYSFTPNSKFVSLIEELTETNFTAISSKRTR